MSRFGETQDRGATGAAFVPSRDVAPAGAASVQPAPAPFAMARAEAAERERDDAIFLLRAADPSFTLTGEAHP